MHPSSLFRIISLLVLALAVGSPSLPGSDYARDVKPVLQARCYPCHGVLKQKAGLRLDTGAAARQGSKSGPILDPSNPDASPLLIHIRSRDPEVRMPPEGEPLSGTQIAAIRSWVADGAPSPADESPERDPRDHWAFRTPSRPSSPEVRNPSWIRNPIDAFVAAEHDRLQITPQPEAARDVLLRRVYLDLIGIPPSREERSAFLADTRPDAYEQVVNHLLDSPHYGERWARHWMDIWRYADWYGRRSVPDVWNSAPQIWRWRDWIVRSLNDDHGYDRMVTEMLAADEVAPEDDDAGVATGFLVRSWYALNPNQWRRDIVEHTGKAFLGLTFNCAHCHDHKYDPISHEDYFRFRAFFEPIGLRQDWVQGEPDPGPFQRYDYSVLRKIARHGTIRILDEEPNAPTHIYLKGDERALPPDKPTVTAGIPRFLQFTNLVIQEIALPPAAHHPGTRSWVREAVLQQATTNLAAARQSFGDAETQRRKALAETNALPRSLTSRMAAETAWISASNRVVVAQAELTSVEARIAADRARFLDTNSSNAPPLMSWASHAERFLALRKIEAQLADARQALVLRETEADIAATRRAAEGQSAKQIQEAQAKDEEALAKSRAQLAQLARNAELANLALNSNSASYTSIGPAYPEHSTGRRRALARWLTDPQNPLTARVAVNHVWSRHLHAPIVATVFDFGRNGSAPSHPALLDWLATELVGHRWSLKHLHRLIVTSSTYRQRGIPPASAGSLAANDSQRAAEIDPDNRFLWHANAGRLESEIVRDAMLAVSGDLDRTVGGPVLPNTEAESSRRRSLYFEVFPEAGGHDGLSELFDPPDPNECYRRTRTILPQQALAMANSRFSHDRSDSLAQRLWNTLPPDRRTAPDAAAVFISTAFEQVLSRPPTRDELIASSDFLTRQSAVFEATPSTPPASAAAQGAATPATATAAAPGADAPARARASLIHALFNHNDFISIR